MKIGFLINPSSGGGQGQKVWEAIRPLVKHDQLNYCAYKTSSPGQVPRVVSRLLDQNIDRLAIIGGDGTINETLQVIMERHCKIPMAIVPAGTGNDLARTIDPSLNAKQAYRNLLSGKTKALDVMQIVHQNNVHYALNYFGVGLDAYVAKQVYQSPRLRKLRKLGYLHSIVDCWSSFTPFDLCVEIDGSREDLDSIWLFAVGNLPFYATMPVNPTADLTDGLLEINVIPCMSKLDVATLLLEARAGSIPKGLVQKKAAQVTLLVQRPMTAQIDGNPVELSGPVQVRAMQQVLPILMS
jgi:diacylglycerol kinase (ATP)